MDTYYTNNLTCLVEVLLHLLELARLPLPFPQPSLDVLEPAAVTHVLCDELVLERVQLPLRLSQEGHDTRVAGRDISTNCV